MDRSASLPILLTPSPSPLEYYVYSLILGKTINFILGFSVTCKVITVTSNIREHSLKTQFAEVRYGCLALSKLSTHYKLEKDLKEVGSLFWRTRNWCKGLTHKVSSSYPIMNVVLKLGKRIKLQSAETETQSRPKFPQRGYLNLCLCLNNNNK